MNKFRFRQLLFWLVFSSLMTVVFIGDALAEESLRVGTQLIWGTNDQKSPDPNHKAIDHALARKLSKSPFRWKYYFEVNRQASDIPVGEMKKVKVSNHCFLEIKDLGESRVEVKLYGEGKLLSTHKEKLLDDWPIVLSGDAKNDTAWLVVIKKMDPARADKALSK